MAGVDSPYILVALFGVIMALIKVLEVVFNRVYPSRQRTLSETEHEWLRCVYDNQIKQQSHIIDKLSQLNNSQEKICYVLDGVVKYLEKIESNKGV